MAARDETSFLATVKKALMVSNEDTFADDEITLHIHSCELYLVSIGLSEEDAKSDDTLVESLILIYVKTFYGFKSDGSVKELPSNFDILARQLVLTRSEVISHDS